MRRIVLKVAYGGRVPAAMANSKLESRVQAGRNVPAFRWTLPIGPLSFADGINGWLSGAGRAQQGIRPPQGIKTAAGITNSCNFGCAPGQHE